MSKELSEIGKLICTQDGRCTADPFFLVQERHKTYGIDFQYDPEIEWVYEDGCRPVDRKMAKKLEAKYQQDDDVEPEGFRRLGYKEEWIYVQGFFTEAAADRYIAENKHRHHELRTYADSLYRNHEMIGNYIDESLIH